jgi:hypothetical protein
MLNLFWVWPFSFSLMDTNPDFFFKSHSPKSADRFERRVSEFHLWHDLFFLQNCRKIPYRFNSTLKFDWATAQYYTPDACIFLFKALKQLLCWSLPKVLLVLHISANLRLPSKLVGISEFWGQHRECCLLTINSLSHCKVSFDQSLKD